MATFSIYKYDYEYFVVYIPSWGEIVALLGNATGRLSIADSAVQLGVYHNTCMRTMHASLLPGGLSLVEQLCALVSVYGLILGRRCLLIEHVSDG